MNCTLNINPTDRDKFNEVLEYMNRKKGTNIQIINSEGWQIELEFEKPQHLFTLGRMFEPYKPAVIAGNMTVNQDNNYLNSI